MKSKYVLADLKEWAEARSGKCLSKKYVRTIDKYLWECENGHQWEASWASLKYTGSWCKKCHKLSIKDLQITAKSRGGKCLSPEYITSGTKLLWECSKGHQWEATPASIRGRESWCPKCANRKALTMEHIRDLAEQKGGKCLSEEYISIRASMLWECEKGHRWWASLSNIKYNKYWCVICQKQIEGSTPTYSERRLLELKELAESRSGLCLSSKFVGETGKLKWKCICGNVWEASPREIRCDKWCPICDQEAEYLRLEGSVYEAEKKGYHVRSETYRGEKYAIVLRCSKGHSWRIFAGEDVDCPECK